MSERIEAEANAPILPRDEAELPHELPRGAEIPEDLDPLADGILKVARSHPEPREIAASVKAHYSWPRFTAEIVDAYETVREPPR